MIFIIGIYTTFNNHQSMFGMLATKRDLFHSLRPKIQVLSFVKSANRLVEIFGVVTFRDMRILLLVPQSSCVESEDLRSFLALSFASS